MAKMVDIDIPVQPTALKGLFVKDAPLNVIEQLQKMGEDKSTANGIDVVHFMFQNLCCGEDGEDFDDINTVEDVKKLGVLRVKAVAQAVRDALDIGGNS